MKELILGGVRSSKSRLAEQRAKDSGLELVYIATARAASDAELRDRIHRHRERRSKAWTVIEEPLALAATLRAQADAHRCVLVDCLTLWLTNLLCSDDRELFARERAAFVQTLPELAGRIILVSNEAGLGVVPMGALSRRFVDESGALHQWLASHCDRVIFTVAGLPLALKGTLR
jgi:adenosylcobinamide kinase/adenosylcobinamide-phosphate guanylyltransferase